MPSTRYLEINALQSPISIGNDSSNRAMLSFNVLCKLSGNQAAFEEEIAKIISNAGLGTLGTNMWFGSLAQLPQAGTGPFITISPTGGLSPLQTHNGDRQPRPAAQIIVRAASYIAARNRANEIYAILDGRHNVTVTT